MWNNKYYWYLLRIVNFSYQYNIGNYWLWRKCSQLWSKIATLIRQTYVVKLIPDFLCLKSLPISYLAYYLPSLPQSSRFSALSFPKNHLKFLDTPKILKSGGSWNKKNTTKISINPSIYITFDLKGCQTFILRHIDVFIFEKHIHSMISILHT